MPKDETLRNGTRQGRNDFRRVGYGGPCPPPGKPHRYFIKVHALDAKLDLRAGAKRDELCVFGKAAKYVFARAKLLPRGDYVGT